MGVCYITRREQREEVNEQLGIYCAGNDARPFGEVEIPSKVITLATRVFQNDEYVTKQEFNETLTEIKESLAALAPKRAESVQTTNF